MSVKPELQIKFDWTNREWNLLELMQLKFECKHFPKWISATDLIRFLQKDSEFENYSNSVQENLSNRNIKKFEIITLFQKDSILDQMSVKIRKFCLHNEKIGFLLL